MDKIVKASKLFSDGVFKIAKGIDAAVEELNRIILDPEVPDRTKLQAIKMLLTYSEKIYDINLDFRLESLEAKLNEFSKKNKIFGGIDLTNSGTRKLLEGSTE